MIKRFLLTGVLFGVLAIVFGAFGAHALKSILNEESMESFKTGVNYQMYHALFLLLLGLIQSKSAKSMTWVMYYLTTFGVICFSGSIYLLVLNKHFEFFTLSKWIALVTPFGGVLLISSWLLLGVYVIKNLKDES